MQKFLFRIDFFNWTPILKATGNKNIEMVKYLIEHGADPFYETDPTVIDWLLLGRRTEHIEYLLSLGVEIKDVNEKFVVDSFEKANLRLAKLIISKGINVNAKSETKSKRYTEKDIIPF